MPKLGPEDFLPKVPEPTFEAEPASVPTDQGIDGEVFQKDEQIPFIPAPYEPDHRQIGAVVPQFLRGIDVSKITSRTEFVRALATNTILNEYNLPIWYYRPDVLDHTLLAACPLLVEPPESGDWTAIESMVNGAIVHLNYDQGFPALENGQPFWSRLPHESKEGNTAFLEYLSLPGARDLTKLVAHPSEQLVEWFYQNYWHYRAVAMDIFRAAHHDRLREQRIMTLEGQHWDASRKLFDRVAKALENKSDEELASMDARYLTQMLSTAGQLQRSSVNLSPLGATKEERSVTSVEVTAQRIAQKRVQKPRDEELDSPLDHSLLNDPEFIEQAQRLIIKVQQ